MTHIRIFNYVFDHLHMAVDGPYHATHAHMSPYDRSPWMTLKQRYHLVQISRRRVRIRKRYIHIVVNQNHKAGFFSQVQHTVYRRIDKTGDATSHLARHEFLVNRELTDAVEHTGKSP